MESHEARWQALDRHVHTAPGVLSPEQRRLLEDPALAPEAARPLLDKLAHRAAEITDADLAALADLGFDDDGRFELVVCGAVAAGSRRMQAGMRALRAALEDTP